MKRPIQNLDLRYEGFGLIRHLVAAEEAIDVARSELTQAMLSTGDLYPGVRSRIVEMRNHLFADEIKSSGGDCQAFDIRSLTLRVGEDACAMDNQEEKSK